MRKLFLKNILIIFGLALTAALVSVFVLFNIFAGKDTAELSNKKPVIKVGVILPLSGDDKELGTIYKNDLEKAKIDLKKNNTQYEYVFIVEDSQSSLAKSAAIAAKLIGVDKVDAILDTGYETSEIIEPIAEKNNVFHLNGSNDLEGQDESFVHDMVMSVIMAFEDRSDRDVEVKQGD